jgi:hypothetical protein
VQVFEFSLYVHFFLFSPSFFPLCILSFIRTFLLHSSTFIVFSCCFLSGAGTAVSAVLPLERGCWRMAIRFTIRASDNSLPKGFQADPRTQQASCAMDTMSCHHGIKAVGSWSWPLIPIYFPP